MKTIEIINARARKPEWSMAEPVNFCLEDGEHIAIIGRNGAGKSMFVDLLTGRHPAFPDMVKYGFDEPYNNLKYISFRDTYGGDNDRTYFLQQRWNQMEIDEETPTVGQKLEEAYQLVGTTCLAKTHLRAVSFGRAFRQIYHPSVEWGTEEIQTRLITVYESKGTDFGQSVYRTGPRNQRSVERSHGDASP